MLISLHFIFTTISIIPFPRVTIFTENYQCSSKKSELHFRFAILPKCGSHLDCFVDEFNYFFGLYKKQYKIDNKLSFFASRVNKSKNNISKMVNVTTKIIGWLVKDNQKISTFDVR
ncbi:hypothetical protein PMAYCL1PPCAC_05986, partial [Pristionchus mayeri]